MMPALLRHVLCVLRGRHSYIYTGRTYLGRDEQGALYSLRYECSNCSHVHHDEEVEV